MEHLTFDHDTHEYRYDGTPVPSVTQIVAPLGADYDGMDELAELAIEAAAERGTALHAYLAWRLGGGTREDFELPGEWGSWADGADLLLEEHAIEPLSIETPVGCETYAGTPDLVCLFDGELAILDYKFVSTMAKARTGAQLAGYQALLQKQGVFPEKLIAVQFTADGSYRLYPVNASAALEAFGACWTVYQFKSMKHPRGRIFGGRIFA